MKYIVIGLGYFGSKLATYLTSMGHEVIGIDNRLDRLDELQDSVTTVMKMDSTNINAIKSLPLDDTDAVIVAIGEDVGSSILTCSALKSLNVKRIIGRATSQIHQSILNQIGIDEVVLPLEDSAMHVASMLQFRNTLHFTELNNDFATAEVISPSKYSGHSLDTISLSERFELKLVAIKTSPGEGLLASVFRRDFKINMFPDPNTILKENDILVVAGRIVNIKRFVES